MSLPNGHLHQHRACPPQGNHSQGVVNEGTQHVATLEHRKVAHAGLADHAISGTLTAMEQGHQVTGQLRQASIAAHQAHRDKQPKADTLLRSVRLPYITWACSMWPMQLHHAKVQGERVLTVQRVKVQPSAMLSQC